jgi:hypothetical protein
MRLAASRESEEMMPRKQRFKPSRKPKPVDAPAGDSQNIPPSETANIDHGNSQRSEQTQGVIEASGEST